MDRALALDLEKAAAPEEDELFVREIEGLIAERKAAKSLKDYAKADGIRESLKKRGIILEDGSSGTLWRRA